MIKYFNGTASQARFKYALHYCKLEILKKSSLRGFGRNRHCEVRSNLIKLPGLLCWARTQSRNDVSIGRIGLFMLLLFCSADSFAHTINYALEKAPTEHVIGYYFKLGFLHIIPQGFDHILFVISLCLISNRVSAILWQATAFTVAHSITLALSMKNVIVAPSAVVEPVIALSILFVAIENILLSELKPWRIGLVFLFGLIHGMGFASSLNEIGLPRNQFAISIISFNLGVELGQICIILAIFLLLVRNFGNKPYYKKRIVYPISVFIGLIALYWTLQRTFFM